MPTITQNRIAGAYPDSQNYTVRLDWENGAKTIASFDHLVGHGVFKEMREPEFFDRVSPGRDGRVLAWPGEIDFSADGLWFTAHPEDVPENLRPYYPPPVVPSLTQD